MAGKNNQESVRRRLLAKLAKQSKKAYETRNRVVGPELSDLAYLIRCAGPRKRHVMYSGIKFPLIETLVWRAAVCPETGIHLVGVFDL